MKFVLIKCHSDLYDMTLIAITKFYHQSLLLKFIEEEMRQGVSDFTPNMGKKLFSGNDDPAEEIKHSISDYPNLTYGNSIKN